MVHYHLAGPSVARSLSSSQCKKASGLKSRDKNFTQRVRNM
jgi:hypothetical protein